jgi:zinc protease
LSENKGIHELKLVKNKVLLTNIPSKQNIDFSIGAPISFTLHHPDYVPLNFALAVLGKWSSFAGRLVSTVREKEGLTYGIYARSEGFAGTEQGYWRIATFFAPDKALQGLTSTFREVTKLYKHGITEAEFDKFRVVLRTSQVLLNDSIMSLMSDLHAYHVHGFTLAEMAEHKNKINLITIKEVNEVIKKYLNPNNLIVAGAGPVNVVKKEIQNFVKSVK